jgi:hypothetical protein
MKYIMILGLFSVVAACAPSTGGSGGGDAATVQSWNRVEGVVEKTTAMGGEIIAKAEGREIFAVIKWRNYDATRDASVSKWYGDMGSPPPSYVVDSLVLAVDGKGISMPKSKYRYLSATVMNEYSANPMSFNQQGKKWRLLVDVGDGSEGWSAVYVFDPAAGTLLSHSVEDGAKVHNQVAQ